MEIIHHGGTETRRKPSGNSPPRPPRTREKGSNHEEHKGKPSPQRHRAALAGTNKASYSACMRGILLLLGLIVLAFGGVVYAGCRSWRKMGAGKRIMGALLLSPHFLLVVCIVVSLLCGHPPQGSSCFNTQFVCAVLLVFILPVPALVGTLTALVIFKRAGRSL